MAAGEATRWNNHLDVPKHLVDVAGQPLLHRTISQFSDHGEVYLTAPENDDRYRIPGVKLFHPPISEGLHDAKKLLDNVSIWNPEGRTIVLWGDVFFTDKAVRKIVTHNPPKWSMYGRFGPSHITGCEYGELFAFSFTPKMRADIEIALHTLAVRRRYDLIGRIGGWELYRLLSGASDLNAHIRYKNFVEINDETEDFDFPHDYERWVQRCLPRIIKSSPK